MTSINRKKKTILSAAFLLAVVFLIFIGNSLSTSTAAGDYEFTGGTVNASYNIYDTLTVPDAFFGNVAAEGVIYFPDGRTYKSKAVRLDAGGKYTLEYRAVIDGKLYTHQTDFNVITTLYSFADNRSSAVYGYNALTDRTGLNVSLARGDVFRFNDVINLNDSSQLAAALEFTFAPQESGKWDARNVYITFRDVYDPDNKVDIWMRMGAGGSSWYYMVARANDQFWTGYDYSGSVPVMRINHGLFGTLLFYTSYNDFTMNDAVIEDHLKKQYVRFWYDEETKQMYLGFPMPNLTTKTTYPAVVPITDFDDTEYQMNPWDGFTTGEVTVEITCENNEPDTADFVFTRIGDKDLTRQTVDDTQGPSIVIDAGEFGVAHMPNGSAGYSYPVFPAVAADVYSGGSVEVQTRVFYAYSRASGIYNTLDGTYAYEIDISNGKFFTPRLGYYAICYRACDYYGNITERVVGITVQGHESAAEMDTLSISTPQTSASAGDFVSLPEILSYGGGTGVLAAGYEVKLNGQAVTVQGNAVQGWKFLPETAGEYVVTAYAEDLIGNRAAQTYAVSVAAPTAPSFDTSVSLPKYFLVAADYILPSFTATDYINNKAPVTATITVIDGAGTRNLTGAPVRFTPDSNGNAVIRYTAGGNYKEYTIPVLSVKNGSALVLANYFVTSGEVVVSPKANGMSVLADGAGSAEFARDIIADGFEVRAMVNPAKNKFGKLSFYLTDMYDLSVSVKVSFLKSAGTAGCEVYVNDAPAGYSLPVANFSNNQALSVSYSATTNRVSAGGGAGLPVKSTIFGAAFNGFPSGRVYVRTALENVSEQSEVYLTRFNNQNLNSDILTDMVAPAVKIIGDYGLLARSVGSEVETLPVLVGDILDPYVSATVSVQYVLSEGDEIVSQEYLVSTDGITLNGVNALSGYRFRADKFGEYVITYAAADSSGKTNVISTKLMVLDEEAPVIKLDGKKPETANRGEVTIPPVSASDNSGKPVSIYTIAVGPDSKTIYVVNGKFEAKYSGVYTVIISAIDANGNTAIERFFVTVK
jgi:hypothetical protein